MNSRLLDMQEIKAERCRRSLSEFVKVVFNTLSPGQSLKWNWHLDCMSDHLIALYYGQIRLLIINIAPRFLKSITCTISFPAWVMGQDGSQQFICGSYDDKLAKKHNVDTRYVMLTDFYKRTFPTRIIPGQNEKVKFVTTDRGHRIAASVGGSSIGEGCNYLVVDDPTNPKRALSESERVFVNETWHDQSMTSRFNDPMDRRELVVMQRLHSKDLTGHLVEKWKDRDDFIHLKLPTRAPKTQVITFPVSGRVVKREKGQLIHPERFGEKEDALARAEFGPYGYSAQHDHEPVPMGGGRIKIKWFPRYDAYPSEPEETVFSFDTGNKKNRENDPSALQVYQRVGKKWYLIYVETERLSYPELKKKTISMAMYYKPDLIIIEDKASGTSLIQDLQENTFLSVEGVNPQGDKIARMEEQIYLLAAGKIALPNPEMVNAEWLHVVEEALMGYPNPSEWDNLDSMSQFLNWVGEREFSGVGIKML